MSKPKSRRSRQNRATTHRKLAHPEPLEPKFVIGEFLFGAGAVATAAMAEADWGDVDAGRGLCVADQQRDWSDRALLSILRDDEGAEPSLTGLQRRQDADDGGSDFLAMTPAALSEIGTNRGLAREVENDSTPVRPALILEAEPSSPSFSSSSDGIYPLVLAGGASSGPSAPANPLLEAVGGPSVVDAGGGLTAAETTQPLAATAAASPAPATSVASWSDATFESPLGPSGGGMMMPDTWSMEGALASIGGSEYVVDWNDGLTLSTDAVEYESEGDSVDLRAQVQDGQVQSYQWSLTNAPLAQNISGANTYHLKFRWGNIPTGYSASEHISLTITYTDLTTSVLDYSFSVLNDGTASASGGAPVSVVRPEVVNPDRIAGNQDVIEGDGYGVSTATGALSTAYLMPSYNPDAPVLGIRATS